MSMRRNFAGGVIGASIMLVLAALAGWEYVKLQIRVNEHSPHLRRIDQQAADFAFQTLDGSTKHLSDFKGKTVFVNLWGTWCIQCVAEMPTVQKLYEHYSKTPDVVFLIVSRLDSPTKVRLYARANQYTLPFYTMTDSDIPSSMQLNQFPVTFLFSPSGLISAQHVGAADWSAPAVISFIDGLREKRSIFDK